MNDTQRKVLLRALQGLKNDSERAIFIETLLSETTKIIEEQKKEIEELKKQ